MNNLLIGIIFLLSATPVFAVGVGNVDPTRVWDKTELNVCVIDDTELLLDPSVVIKRYEKEFDKEKFESFPDYLIQPIKTAVTTSFSSTPIHFNGWEKCSLSPHADVFLTISSHYKEAFAAGTIGDPSKNITLLNKTKTSVRINKNMIQYFRKKFSNQKLFNAVFEQAVVHEFAHVIGMQHENLRRDALVTTKQMDFSGFNYAGIIDDSRKIIIKRPDYYAQAIGTFDVLSISNYFLFELIKPMAFLKEYCKTSKANPFCDFDKINSFLPNLDPIRGYFSDGDIDTINNLYLSSPVNLAWQSKSKNLINWLAQHKKAIQKILPKNY